MSHDTICTLNVPVVRINGNIISVGRPTEPPYDVLFRSTNLTVTSPYGRSCKAMIGLIRDELRCTHHDWGPLQRFKLSHDRICNYNVSILCMLCMGVIMCRFMHVILGENYIMLSAAVISARTTKMRMSADPS